MNDKKQKLSVQPYKGARDFYPEDMRIENYIYDTWKKVCRSYGFEQYDFPILEPWEIFAAKTGQEIVNEQLFSLEDKGGRKLAVRPELTPGTVRMIAQRYKEIQQPIKWFMIGSNWRYEKPQLGRGREFNQLEANIFGVPGVEADFETISLIINIMKEFGANETMFEIRISDRRLVAALLNETLKLDEIKQVPVRRIMDKRAKMQKADFEESLTNLGLNKDQIAKVDTFMESSLDTVDIPSSNPGLQTLIKLFNLIKQADLSEYISFDPSIIRGFDYSDSIVYEVYDKNPANKRSIFGGERFDKLINIFGDYELPSTGFAMGDYTLLEFLKGWNLLPQPSSSVDYFVTLWPSEDNKFFIISNGISNNLRELGKNTFTWLDKNTKLDKQLKYANSKKAQYAVIVGEEELSNGTVTIKNMTSGQQETKSLEKFLELLK